MCLLLLQTAVDGHQRGMFVVVVKGRVVDEVKKDILIPKQTNPRLAATIVRNDRFINTLLANLGSLASYVLHVLSYLLTGSLFASELISPERVT